MPESAEKQAHLFRVSRACTRRLSGSRPLTMSEQLATLREVPADLDVSGDRYGDGPVAVLEERVAALLGRAAAVFFPTGTMAQQVAMRCWATRCGSNTVALHPQAHPEVHERHAFSTLSGLRTVWPTPAPRQPTAAEVRDLAEPFGILMLELPLRDPGFLLPTWEELVEVTGAARTRGARVHFDGARIWETTPHFGRDLETIAALADSVYVSFYKSLGGLAGAALAGPADFIAEARAWRVRYGGNVFQQWPAALAALSGIEHVLPRIPSYVEHAKVVAEVLGELPGARVHPHPPHTHQFQLWLPHSGDALNQAALALAEEEKVWFAYGWSDRPPTGMSVTEITIGEPALDWTADEIARTASAFLSRLA